MSSAYRRSWPGRSATGRMRISGLPASARIRRVRSMLLTWFAPPTLYTSPVVPRSIRRSTARQWSATCSQSRSLRPSPYSGSGQVVDRVRDEERDDLLRELVRSVVVRRARDDHGNGVRRPVAVRQPIGAGLARGVRVPRPQFVGLPARPIARRCRTPRRSRSGRTGAAGASDGPPRAARTCRRRRS